MTEKTQTPLPAVPENGKCTACNGLEFTFSKDSTTYEPCIRFTDGELDTSQSYTETEDSSAEESVRFYCMKCGERYAVPEELQ